MCGDITHARGDVKFGRGSLTKFAIPSKSSDYVKQKYSKKFLSKPFLSLEEQK